MVKSLARASKGFTIIELMIVMSLIVIMAATSVPFIQTFTTSADLNTYSDTVAKFLARAQIQAQTGQNNASWGVYFDNGGKRLILFKGASYATRDTDYDQEQTYPDIFEVSSTFGDEIVFSLYSGLPSVSGNLTLAGPNNETKIITVATYGLIEAN